jgi:hypothetical protein
MSLGDGLANFAAQKKVDGWADALHLCFQWRANLRLREGVILIRIES